MMTLVENEKITMHNDGRFIITSFAAAGIEGGDYCAQNSTNETRTMANCLTQLSIVCAGFYDLCARAHDNELALDDPGPRTLAVNLMEIKLFRS